MNQFQVEKLFSKERLEPYYLRSPNYQDALQLYKRNIQLSEAFYTSLSIVEVVLRNAIHYSCRQYFKDEYWFKNKLPAELVDQVIKTEIKLKSEYKVITADRIISELTFGFWTTLFNRKYASLLWKPLHQIFIHSPHHLRQRAEISPRLNAIRKFRNRTHHYEPICWNIAALKKQHNTILEILNWLDTEILEWVEDIDRLPEVIGQIKQKE